MKIALIGHGQPRFTNSFVILMSQLHGFDVADFYMCFWKTDWAPNADVLKEHLQPHLLPNYNLKEIKVIDQPEIRLPNPQLNHTSEEKVSVRWSYKRRQGMWLSLKLANDLIKDDYDLVIKFRPDGRLDKSVDVRTLDLSHEMIFPSNSRCGHPGREICDQFLFATREGMNFYSDLINHFDEYITKVAPNWEYDTHAWASEHLLGEHLAVHNKKQFVGDYQCLLRVDGVSPNDDNWYRGF
jgi:hypothetical protein